MGILIAGIVLSFRTKNKLKSHKKVCENEDFCNVIMPSEDTKILESNQYQNFYKAPFIIHAELKCLIEKINGCTNNSEDSFAIKVSKHLASCFSMFTASSFRSINIKHDVSRSEDCMKNFCEFLREHAMKMINFKKKEMKLLTKESYENSNICFICKKNLKISIWKIKNTVNLEIIVIIQENIEVLRIACVI